MDRADLRYELVRQVDWLLDRDVMLSMMPGEPKRTFEALRKLYQTSDLAVDMLLLTLNLEENKLTKQESEVMAKKKQPTSKVAKTTKDTKAKVSIQLDYMVRCPDCMPLLTTFPASCVSELLNGVKNLLSGQPIADIHCFAHCASTLLWWGESLWLVGHIHDDSPVTLAKKATTSKPINWEEVKEELEVLEGSAEDYKKNKSTDGLKGAINWGVLFAALLKILELIKPFFNELEDEGLGKEEAEETEE